MRSSNRTHGRGTLRALGLLLLAAPPTLGAQARPAATDTVPAYLLEGITVTSTRAPARRDDVPQKIEVVTGTDLRRTIADEFTDALKKNAAVDVIQFPGLLSGVAIRGFRPQYSGINPRTLVLVDGRPAGTANLATLDLTATERVEVLRGPASALYGSSAMGGVVNVVTRQSQGPIGGRISGGYGSFDRYSAQVAAGGSLLGGLDFDLSVAGFGQSAGYRTGSNRLIGDDFVTKTLADGTTERLPEVAPDTVISFSEYGYRTRSLRLGMALGDAWRLDARGTTFGADGVQNPGDLGAPWDGRSLKDLQRTSREIALSGALERHALTLRGYRSVETSHYYDRAFAPNFVSFRTPIRVRGAQIQDVVRFGAGTLTAGVDHTSSRAESERFTAPDQRGAPWSPDSRIASTAGFAEGRLGLLDDRLVATLGGRLDRVTFEVMETGLLPTHRANRETHTVFNPSAGLQYRTPGGLRLRTSGGRAFVTPDAFNVAGYAETGTGSGAVSIARGNPELRPESSVSWDAGAGLFRPRAGIDADLTYFHTNVRDRISTRPTPGGGLRTPAGDSIRSITSYVNVDEAQIRGLEASLGYDLGALRDYAYSLRLFSSATRILRADEITGGARQDIRNVADLTLLFGAEYDDLRRFATRLSGRYVGERVDTDFTDFSRIGDVRYPAFLVLDLTGGVRLGDRYRLGLGVSNLTDENYYEVRGYNLPGRALRLDVGVTF
jgi:vitamin B12 transporter